MKAWLSGYVVRRSLVGSDMTIMVVSAIHLYEAIIFMFVPSGWGSVGMASFLRAFHSPGLAYVALLAAVMMALAGQWSAGLDRRERFFLLLPQLSLLMITSMSAIYHVGIQHYADCTEAAGCVHRSWAFISTDQAHRIAMPILYIAAMYARVRDRP